MCVCLSGVQDDSKSIELINFIFVKAFSLIQGGNHSILKTKCPGVRVDVGGGGVPKFGPND